MTFLSSREVVDLLRAASERGDKRKRELAEHAREAFATGPAARVVPLSLTAGLYFPEAIEAHKLENKRTLDVRGKRRAR